MIYVEAFLDPDGTPIVRSEPLYETVEDADAEIVAMLKDAFPDRQPFAVDPSIGV